jgi:hypothetical protein
MTRFLELRAIQLCGLAVMCPWIKPAVGPVARWLTAKHA